MKNSIETRNKVVSVDGGFESEQTLIKIGHEINSVLSRKFSAILHKKYRRFCEI